MLKEVFKDKIVFGLVVMPNNVIVPIETFEKIFADVADNPTYENMMEINDLGLDEEGNPKERGYSEFLNQCKSEGILN